MGTPHAFWEERFSDEGEFTLHWLCCIYMHVCVSSANRIDCTPYVLNYLWSKLCCCSFCLHDPGVLQVSGMRIYTSGNMEAVNGTDARLKCTFQSSAPINPSVVTISWTFRPLGQGKEETVSMCVCLCVFAKTVQTSLTVLGLIHPLSQPREESVSHQALCGASETACEVYLCVCILRKDRIRSSRSS